MKALPLLSHWLFISLLALTTATAQPVVIPTTSNPATPVSRALDPDAAHILGGTVDQARRGTSTRTGKTLESLSPAGTCADGWDPGLANQFNGGVGAIAFDGTGNVYVGGTFTTAGGVTVNGIAKWNGRTWSALGSGVNGHVNAIAISGSDVYAGGSFSFASGVQASSIAKWNGTAWSAVGIGVTGGIGQVRAIAISGTDVYIGGSFESVDNVAGTRMVAKWNGSTWAPLVQGLRKTPNPTGGSVLTLAVSGSDLYAGGTFTHADQLDLLGGIAKWDGTAWSGLGSGIGFTNKIVVVGGEVYMVGVFNGPTDNDRLAKWNGSTWTTIGTTVGPTPAASGLITSLAFSGNNIYIGGVFVSVNGISVSRIAKWDGNVWSSVEGGMNDSVSRIAVSGNDLYVGGAFTMAGCTPSGGFARLFGSRWNGSQGADWHTASNWNDSSMPGSTSSVIISAADTSILSADATVNDLTIKNGRVLTVAAGRTLTVNGELNLSNGSIVGPGTVVIASCAPDAIQSAGPANFIKAPLSRCVSAPSIYVFPVGTGSDYRPVELSGITGTATFTVEANAGAHSSSGLPANRLQRWWNLTNGGITKADLTFHYSDSEVVGSEGMYRAYRIDGSTADKVPTYIDQTGNRAVVPGVTTFSPWTLAELQQSFGTVSGRVTTASGIGASGTVIVTLTDFAGNKRFAVTNPLGFYRFTNVETWRPYVIGLTTKRYTFSENQRTVPVGDDLTNVDFVSTDH